MCAWWPESCPPFWGQLGPGPEPGLGVGWLQGLQRSRPLMQTVGSEHSGSQECTLSGEQPQRAIWLCRLERELLSTKCALCPNFPLVGTTDPKRRKASPVVMSARSNQWHTIQAPPEGGPGAARGKRRGAAPSLTAVCRGRAVRGHTPLLVRRLRQKQAAHLFSHMLIQQF